MTCTFFYDIGAVTNYSFTRPVMEGNGRDMQRSYGLTPDCLPRFDIKWPMWNIMNQNVGQRCYYCYYYYYYYYFVKGWNVDGGCLALTSHTWKDQNSILRNWTGDQDSTDRYKLSMETGLEDLYWGYGCWCGRIELLEHTSWWSASPHWTGIGRPVLTSMTLKL